MKSFFCKALVLSLSMSTLWAQPSVLRIENLNGVATLNYQTGIDSLGNSTIAYTFTNKGRQNIFVQAITLNSHGVQVNISPAYEFDPSLPGINIPAREYQLAVSPSGNAILVWTARVNTRSVIMGAFMPSSFGPWVVTELSSSSFNVTDFNAAIDESGNAVVAWRVPNGISPSRNVVQAAYKLVSGAWEVPGVPSDPRNVLSPFFFNVTSTPSVGIAQGNATVAWPIYNGINGIPGTVVVQASFKAKDFPFELYRTIPNGSTDPRNQSAIISTLGFRVSSAPIVTASANTSVITWQIVGNPNTRLPDNVIQAFVRHF